MTDKRLEEINDLRKEIEWLEEYKTILEETLKNIPKPNLKANTGFLRLENEEEGSFYDEPKARAKLILHEYPLSFPVDRPLIEALLGYVCIKLQDKWREFDLI